MRAPDHPDDSLPLYEAEAHRLLARALELPEAIAGARPTTDTFSLPQTQEEFYFGWPYEQMDLLVWGREVEVEPDRLAPLVGLGPDEVEGAYGEIDRVRVATAYPRAPAVIIGPDVEPCAGSPASFTRRRGRRSTRSRCGGWPARSATAGRTGTGTCSTPAPGW